MRHLALFGVVNRVVELVGELVNLLTVDRGNQRVPKFTARAVRKQVAVTLEIAEVASLIFIRCGSGEDRHKRDDRSDRIPDAASKSAKKSEALGKSRRVTESVDCGLRYLLQIDASSSGRGAYADAASEPEGASSVAWSSSVWKRSICSGERSLLWTVPPY